MNANHIDHVNMVVTPEELRREDFIMAKAGCAVQMMELAGLEPGRGRPHIRYQASDSATILAMVREGIGITLQPRMMVPKKLEGVVALSFDPPQRLEIGIAIRSQDMASPAARLFVQTALAWMQEQAVLSARAR